MILANSPERPHSGAKPQRDIESGIEEIFDASSRTTPELSSRDKQQQQQLQIDASSAIDSYFVAAKDQIYQTNDQEEKQKQNQQNTTMTTLMMIHPNIVIENHKEIEIENGCLKLNQGNHKQSSQKKKSKEQLEQNDSQNVSSNANNIFKPHHSEIQSAKILTYNIFLRPPLIKNNLDDYKNERTKMILNVINGFDVICFQELFGFLNQRKHKIIYSAMKQGFYYHAQSPSPSFFSSYLVDGGLVTLSRFPIVAKCFKPFKYGVMSDNLSQKGVLYTKIQMKEQQQNIQISRTQSENQMNQDNETKQQKTKKMDQDLRNDLNSDFNDEQGPFIHLFNTHLQASYIGKESNIKATVITRIDQLLFIKEFIHEQVKKHRNNPDDLILICGDFNVNARGHIHPLHYLREFTHLHSLMEAIHPTEFCEYNLLKTILSENSKFPFTDTLKARFNGESPVTYADTFLDPQTDKELPLEVALTIEEDLLLKSCIDYIIDLKIPYESPKTTGFSESIEFKPTQIAKTSTLSVDIPQVSVEKFFVENQLFTQLSDHYGVSATLIVQSSIKSELNNIDSGCDAVQQQIQHTTEKDQIQINNNTQSKQALEFKYQDSNHFNHENQLPEQIPPSHNSNHIQRNGTASSQKPSIYPELKYQPFE